MTDKLTVSGGKLVINGKEYTAKQLKDALGKQEEIGAVKQKPVITVFGIQNSLSEKVIILLNQVKCNMAEEAFEYEKYMNAKARITNYIHKNYPFQPDWGDNEQYKYEIQLYKNDVNIGMWVNYQLFQHNFPVMQKEEHAQDVLDKFKDNLEIVHKYLLTHN